MPQISLKSRTAHSMVHGGGQVQGGLEGEGGPQVLRTVGKHQAEEIQVS